jgi:hypothetical protein
VKLTLWYPADVKPARPGVYEVFSPSYRFFRKWDGTNWCIGSLDVERASRSEGRACWLRTWRGLASPDGN